MPIEVPIELRLVRGPWVIQEYYEARLNGQTCDGQTS